MAKKLVRHVTANGYAYSIERKDGLRLVIDTYETQEARDRMVEIIADFTGWKVIDHIGLGVRI